MVCIICGLDYWNWRIENAATTTNQPLSHQLSLENRRVSDRLRRQGESDEQREEGERIKGGGGGGAGRGEGEGDGLKLCG